MANSQITFWSKGSKVIYNLGDLIRKDHLHYLETYHSGKLTEADMFKINTATININSGKVEKSVLKSLSELKKSIFDLKEVISNFTVIDGEPCIDKKTHIKLKTDNIAMTSQSNITVEGIPGDEVKTGPSVSEKVETLKKMEQIND